MPVIRQNILWYTFVYLSVRSSSLNISHSNSTLPLPFLLQTVRLFRMFGSVFFVTISTFVIPWVLIPYKIVCFNRSCINLHCTLTNTFKFHKIILNVLLSVNIYSNMFHFRSSRVQSCHISSQKQLQGIPKNVKVIFNKFPFELKLKKNYINLTGNFFSIYIST